MNTLITGASAGIGADLADICAAAGHNVILVARREERLQALAERLESTYGTSAYVIPADLSRPGAAEEILEAVGALGLEVDNLVNNAGYGTTGKFWELETQREVDQVQVNVTALLHLTRLFLPAMVERGRGRVLNMASTAGFQPGPFMATYYATKAFVISFTDALAFELDGTGVTATAACPGATESEFGVISGNGKNKLFTKGGAASSRDVAQHAFDAMMGGKSVAVHGAVNAVGAFAVRLSPRGVVNHLAAKLNRP